MKNKEVIQVITQGRAYKSSSFLLKMATNKDFLAKNTSFLAPKKQFSTAVLRNKAKRRLKSSLQNHFYGNKKGFDTGILYVFTLSKSILGLSFEQLREELEQFFAKNDILKTL